MRKAKVVAIVCGILASCLIGGFAVVDAATITLDDSSTTESVAEMAESVEVPTEAATETSLETTAPVRESIAAETTEAVTEPTEPETTAETAPAEEETTEAAEPAAAEQTAAEAPDETEPAEADTEETLDLSNVSAEDEIYIQNGNLIQNPVSYDMPAVAEPIAEPVVEEESDNSWVYSVSERDYILLCNAVGHEAGANEISVEEKAKVVEVIMNRVYSDIYPDDVYSVLTQQNQFTGASTYVDLGTFSPKVSDMVKEAVDLYFSDPSRFDHGYIGFWGDGHQNHFKTY